MEGVCGPVMACMLLPASAGGLPARAEMVLAVPVVALLSEWAIARDASARGATRLLAWEPETGIAEQVKRPKRCCVGEPTHTTKKRSAANCLMEQHYIFEKPADTRAPCRQPGRLW